MIGKDNKKLKAQLLISFSVLVVGIAGNSFTPFSPSIVGGMVDFLGFSLESAGRMASLEFSGIAAGTIASNLFLHRINISLKNIALTTLLILLLCNISTLFVLAVLFKRAK